MFTVGHNPRLICGKCGSSSHEHVTRGIVSFTRCIGCGHEGDKTDVTTGMPYITPEERARQHKMFDVSYTTRQSDKPITF